MDQQGLNIREDNIRDHETCKEKNNEPIILNLKNLVSITTNMKTGINR